MADNTLQDRWIDKIKGGLDAMFRDHPDVFVASNLMWYPVEGNNLRRLAPDVMVAFGLPKGDRDSYVVHEEGVSPQVFFEILSPGNRKRVMDFKRKIYELYDVEEYYVFNPYKIKLEVWLREDDAFRLIPEAETSGWISPRLGIRFELGENLTIYAPDGRPFVDYAEVARQRDESEEESRRAHQRVDQVELQLGLAEQRVDEERRQRTEAEQRAQAESQRADGERQRADEERRQRAEAEQRAERLAARLRELGLEPEA